MINLRIGFCSVAGYQHLIIIIIGGNWLGIFIRPSGEDDGISWKASGGRQAISYWVSDLLAFVARPRRNGV